MIQALLKGKLNQYLTKSPFEIEDLLTSIVFGSCQYVPPEHGVMPFLARARSGPTKADTHLSDLIGEISDVEYEFWPNWCAISGIDPMLASKPPDLSNSNDAGGPIHSASGEVCGAIPELVLKFRRTSGKSAWIIIEAKLFSGKSSYATSVGPVSDQLGKYWLQLKLQAEREKAEPLAIVYVTQGVFFPASEFDETKKELLSKGHPPAPLFWLSWRVFADCIERPLPLIRDVICLLRDKWQLVYVEMEAWPQLPVTLPHYDFTESVIWPIPPFKISALNCHVLFEWSRPINLGRWEFQTSWNWVSAEPALPVWDFEELEVSNAI